MQLPAIYLHSTSFELTRPPRTDAAIGHTRRQQRHRLCVIGITEPGLKLELLNSESEL